MYPGPTINPIKSEIKVQCLEYLNNFPKQLTFGLGGAWWLPGLGEPAAVLLPGGWRGFGVSGN